MLISDNSPVRKIISILTLYRMRMQGYCDVYKWTFLKRTSPEVKCLHPMSSRREMDTLSICNGLSQIFTRRLFLYFYILYFYFDDKCLENVRHYRYLGVYFSASGNFNYGQDDIFKKASFKLTKLITSGEPSINNSLHFY